eukprot:scaffold17310_cov61-Phaeocystis_antarctica.AAC.2
MASALTASTHPWCTAPATLSTPAGKRIGGSRSHAPRSPSKASAAASPMLFAPCPPRAYHLPSLGLGWGWAPAVEHCGAGVAARIVHRRQQAPRVVPHVVALDRPAGGASPRGGAARHEQRVDGGVHDGGERRRPWLRHRCDCRPPLAKQLVAWQR